MYNTYKIYEQIKEEKAKLNKEIRKLRRKEHAEIDNGTWNNEEYKPQWKYLQGKLDALHTALRIIECNLD